MGNEAWIKIISKRAHQLLFVLIHICPTSYSSALTERCLFLKVLHWTLIIIMCCRQIKQQIPIEKFQLWASVYLLAVENLWRENVQKYLELMSNSHITVVQLLSHVWLFATPWTVAHQASPSFTISWSLLKFMSIGSVMPSNYLILCHPFLLLPSTFPSIRVFSNELALHQVARVLEPQLQYQSFQWVFRVDFP